MWEENEMKSVVMFDGFGLKFSDSLSAVDAATHVGGAGGVLPVCHRRALPSCFHTQRQNFGYADARPAPASSPVPTKRQEKHYSRVWMHEASKSR